MQLLFKNFRLLGLSLVLAMLGACVQFPPIEPYPYPIPDNPDSERDRQPDNQSGNRNPYPETSRDNPDRQGDYPDTSENGDGYPSYPSNPDQPQSDAPPPPRPVNEPESTNQAVIALVKESEAYESAGEYSKAGSQLERALRIEPRNPWLVYRLAKVRLEQGEASQSESFARKSIRLAELSSFDPYTKRKIKYLNWQLITDARRQRGDSGGAREAEDRTRDYVI